MISITRCGICKGEIEFGEEQDGEVIDCPHCGAKTAVLSSEAKRKLSPGDYVKQIRAGTCYKTLHGVLRAIFVVLLLLQLITFAGALGVLFVNERPIEQTAGVLFMDTVWVALTIAGYQASQVLIDIADSLIDQGRRR